MRLQYQIQKTLSAMESSSAENVELPTINGVSFENIQSIARSVERLQGQRELEERYDAGNRLQLALNSLESMGENLAVSEDVNTHAFVKMGLESLGRSIGMELHPEHLQRQTQIVRHALNKVEEQNLSFESKFGFEELQDELNWVGPVSEVADIDGDIEAVADESETLIQDATAFEALIEKVNEVNAKGGFTPQSLKALNFALETFSLRYGQPDAEVRVTEGAAMEGLGDAFKAIWEKIKEVSRNIWNHLKKFFLMHLDNSQLSAMEKQIQEMEQLLRDGSRAAKLQEHITKLQPAPKDILTLEEFSLLGAFDKKSDAVDAVINLPYALHQLLEEKQPRNGEEAFQLVETLLSNTKRSAKSLGLGLSVSMVSVDDKRMDETVEQFFQRVKRDYKIDIELTSTPEVRNEWGEKGSSADLYNIQEMHGILLHCLEKVKELQALRRIVENRKPLLENIPESLIAGMSDADRKTVIEAFRVFNAVDRQNSAASLKVISLQLRAMQAIVKASKKLIALENKTSLESLEVDGSDEAPAIDVSMPDELANDIIEPQVDAAALADSFEDFQDSFRAIIEKIKEIAKKIWTHIQAFYDRLRFKSDSEKLAKLAEAARANEDKAAEIDKKIAEKQLKVSDILSKRQLTTILRYGDAGVNIFTLARGVDKNIHSLFSPGMSRGDAMKSLKAFLHSGHENPIFQVSQFVGMEVKVPYPQRTDEADIDFIKRVREEFTVVHHESKGHPDDIDSAMNSTLAEGIAPWSTHSGRIECIESARQVLATANSFIDFAKSEKPLFDRISPNLIDEIEKGDRDFFIQYFQLINLIDRKARVVLQGLMAGVKQYASVVVSTMSKIEQLGSAEATPATESLNASLEADIKQLKSGTKVKFSHGHGKITKVCTGPFMLAGKHHHASKDEPRFIVRADKGGHLSVHKASALKLV